MSTIVAVLKNNVACIAADSLTSFGDTRQPADYVTDYDKILPFAGNNYIGIVGSAAHHLVMQNLLHKHADKIDFSDRFSIFESMRLVHPILKEEYFLNSKDDDDDSYESSRVDALIINPAGIFGLYSTGGCCLNTDSSCIRCAKSINPAASGRLARVPSLRSGR